MDNFMFPITIRLFAELQDGRFTQQERMVAENITVRDIVRDLKILDHEFGIALVNKKVVDLNYVVKQGETLSLYPQIGGG